MIAHLKLMRGLQSFNFKLTFGFSFVLMALLSISPTEAKTTAKAAESCIAGDVKESKFRLGSSGFDEEDMSLVEGVAGPELHIGKTRIFLNPKNNVEDGQESDSKLNEWCVVDPVLSRELKPSGNANAPMCGDSEVLNAPDENGKGGKPMKIRGQNGKVIGELHMINEKGPDGKKRSRLLLKPSGSGSNDVHNQIHLTGEAKSKKGGGEITTKLRVESRNIKDDKTNGVVESSMKGRSPSESKEGDAMSAVRLTGCQSTNQTKGQLRKKEDEAPSGWVDLSGSHIVMRGTEKYGVDTYKPQEDKTPQYMVDETGRK